MPRVGYASADQTQSSQFKFGGGPGEVVNNVVVNEDTPFGVKCGMAITIQGWTKDWKKPLDDEPVTEFLSAGGVDRFHPSTAKSNEDPDPVDLGAEPGVEGNCLYAVEDKGPDTNSKLSKFGASLEGKGVKAGLLNGYAPNLIGLKAVFHQEPQTRGPNQKEGTRDPTQLVVKEIAAYPPAQTGKAAGAATGPQAVPAAAKGTAGSKKANGVAAPAPTPAVEPATAGGEAESGEAATALMQILVGIGKKNAGTVIPKSKLGGKVVVPMAAFPQPLHAGIQALLKDDEWFTGAIEDLGWGYENGQVGIPAA